MANAKEMLKAALRRAANVMGYDIVAYDSKNAHWRLAQLLRQYDITMLFDVGANRGAFAWDMRELGYHGRIVSFEPLKDVFAQLQKAARSDTAWQVVNIGLGDRDEQRQINIAQNSQSSSFLPMLDAHKDAAPESSYQGQETASIRRLDGIFADYCQPADRIFLKIDTQGFEKHVLAGASNILNAVPLAQLECSLVPLYRGADVMEDIIGYMRGLGYDPVDALPTFYHRDTHHLMQADVLFVRRAAGDN